jgi:signal peptidase II
MKKFNIRFFIVALTISSADVLTKMWAVKTLSGKPIVSVIGDFLQFRFVINTGGVFGIFQGNPVLFHILSGLAIVFLIIYYIKTTDQDIVFEFAMASVAGGAFGNFTDRFFRPGVVDFIDMGFWEHRWPTYNIADVGISVGAGLLLLAFYRMEKKAKENTSNTSEN